MLTIESEYQYFLIVNFLGSLRTTLMFLLHDCVCVCVCVCGERVLIPTWPGIC